ncbi:hypothetical protein RJ639_017824 [Escallonia herrerae]|uniref:Uncharacterized protein n=1 Tax=Escallonia herrerae TaxID=1293975 RepID=A0AA88VFS5_9ASTE|nr:hypothetical protein RJ639_017824 [Escallonia herrerae]
MNPSGNAPRSEPVGGREAVLNGISITEYSFRYKVLELMSNTSINMGSEQNLRHHGHTIALDDDRDQILFVPSMITPARPDLVLEKIYGRSTTATLSPTVTLDRNRGQILIIWRICVVDLRVAEEEDAGSGADVGCGFKVESGLLLGHGEEEKDQFSADKAGRKAKDKNQRSAQKERGREGKGGWVVAGVVEREERREVEIGVGEESNVSWRQMGSATQRKPRPRELRNPSIIVVIKKYILRLNITVDDLVAALVMQVKESSGNFNGNLGPLIPTELQLPKKKTC